LAPASRRAASLRFGFRGLGFQIPGSECQVSGVGSREGIAGGVEEERSRGSHRFNFRVPGCFRVPGLQFPGLERCPPRQKSRVERLNASGTSDNFSNSGFNTVPGSGFAGSGRRFRVPGFRVSGVGNRGTRVSGVRFRSPGFGRRFKVTGVPRS